MVVKLVVLLRYNINVFVSLKQLGLCEITQLPKGEMNKRLKMQPVNIKYGNKQ